MVENIKFLQNLMYEMPAVPISPDGNVNPFAGWLPYSIRGSDIGHHRQKIEMNSGNIGDTEPPGLLLTLFSDLNSRINE